SARCRDLFRLSADRRAPRVSHRKAPRLAKPPGHVVPGLRGRGDPEARGRAIECARPRRTQAYEAGWGLTVAGSWLARLAGSVPTTAARAFCQKAESSSSAEPITKAVSATLSSTAPKVWKS